MRIALLSDVHANYTALQTVMQDLADHGGADTTWFLGDAVGYGPEPRQCVQLLADVLGEDCPWLLGNHDLAAQLFANGAVRDEDQVQALVGNMGAAVVAELHGLEMSIFADTRWYHRFISAPFWCTLQNGIGLAHGTVIAPTDSEANVVGTPSYVTDTRRAFEALRNLVDFMPACSCRILCVGHSHVQQLMRSETGDRAGAWSESTQLKSGAPTERSEIVVPLPDHNERWTVLNPGSVGQARGSQTGESDARAGYAVLSVNGVEASVSFRRIPYDVAAVQTLMREASYPSTLIDRLAMGI